MPSTSTRTPASQLTYRLPVVLERQPTRRARQGRAVGAVGYASRVHTLADSSDDERESADLDVERAWVSGSDAALRLAYDQFAPMVHTYCVPSLGDADAAADATQETFLSAWRSRDRFDADKGRLAAWIMAIARFRTLDAQRARGRAPVPSADIESGDTGRSVDLDEQLSNQLLVRHALDTLSGRARSVVELAYFSDLTNSEIAERTGLPLGTVKSDIRRGLQRLREYLQGGGIDG